MPRASWDDYFLQIASTVASRSTCVRRHVGAVVVADRHIVATGYNGPPSGMPHCDDGGCPRALQTGVARSVDYSSCVATHAELNGLLQSAPANRDGATLYCTDLPCWDCARAVANSGIVRVVAAGGMYDSWPTTAAFLADAGIATDGPAATTPGGRRVVAAVDAGRAQTTVPYLPSGGPHANPRCPRQPAVRS